MNRSTFCIGKGFADQPIALIDICMSTLGCANPCLLCSAGPDLRGCAPGSCPFIFAATGVSPHIFTETRCMTLWTPTHSRFSS